MDADALYGFLAHETGREVSALTDELRLERDLGIYGDEAIDFLTRFSATFGVDVSGFDVSRHFSAESDRIGRFFARIFTGKDTLDLTVGDLAKAVAAGRLV